MKRLFLLLGFLFFASPAHATNAVYVSQSGAGVQSGVSCLTAVPASYFNSSANWNGSPTGIQIGPNTTVHLCGTISSTLIAQGSGAAGNPIIILFEPGAKISQPICPATGCLNLDGKTDITVDGNGVLDSFGHLQTVNGIIESTANGSAFPGRTANSRCAEADSSNRVTFQKIEVQNCYVHVVSPLDTTPSAPDPTGIHAAGALTFKVLHSIIHDANWAIYAGNGVGPIEVGWTEIYNIDHGLAVGVINENFVGVSFHDNHVHDLVNWDTTATACSGNPCYHHDGTHMFKTPGGTGNISQIVISSSLFDGDWGIYNTAMNFTELQSGDQTMYNNS